MSAADSGAGQSRERSQEELLSQLGFLEEEVHDLRRRLAEGPVHSRALEARLAETQRSLAAVTAQRTTALMGRRPDACARAVRPISQ